MGFKYRVKLLGFNEKISGNEITSRSYRDLVKSLYNNDSTAFVLQLQDVIEQVSPGILQEGLNVVDKIVLLLHMRSISISPDLKLKARCPSTNKEFEINIKLEDLLVKLENVNYFNTIVHENIQITHSVAKVKDEIHFVNITPDKVFSYQLASCIDKVSVNDKTLHFKDLSFEQRCEVVEKLPLILASQVFDSVIQVEAKLLENRLLYIVSPFTGEPVVSLPVSTDVKIIIEFCRLIFNDDLANLYKLNYNLVNKGNFTPEYSDSITPAEQLLYWTYYVQQAQKEQEAYESANKGNSNDIKFGGSNAMETPSEFTG